MRTLFGQTSSPLSPAQGIRLYLAGRIFRHDLRRGPGIRLGRDGEWRDGVERFGAERGGRMESVARQVPFARVHLSRRQRTWSSLSPKEIDRIVDLIEDNLREEPASEQNMRIWFRAIRFSGDQDIDRVLDRLMTWKVTGDSTDAYYYVYVLHVLKAIDGSVIERERAVELIEQSRARARFNRGRRKSFEWLGKGDGLRRLIHNTELGDWDDSTGFFTDVTSLARVDGRIQKIERPESGLIELASCGLSAFFAPAVAGVERGRHENARVKFFLGFSYDGLRAWNVETLR